MNFKDKNLLNLFNPAKVNNNSLIMTVMAILPAAFVAKTIESALVFLLLALIFFITSTLLAKLMQVIFKDQDSFVTASVLFVLVAVLVGIFARAFFIEFDKEFSIYIILLANGSLPYMLRADNEDKTVDKAMLNTLKSFLGFAAIILIVAIFREILGTGMITFGTYTSITINVNLFKNYALTLLANPLSSFLVLGFITAILKGKEEEA